MKRYSIITEKNPREILLLRGSGCKWRKCVFCDYHLDFSKDDSENYRLNKKELESVTGQFGVLETINSGSFCDLDDRTVEEIRRVCSVKGIKRLHIECHWRDRAFLAEIKAFFGEAGIRVLVKTGVETFDVKFRDNILQKGMEYASPQEIAVFADEVCLLFGLTGQTEQSMIEDVETGLQYFDRICINLMTENSRMKPDRAVLDIFMKKLYPKYRDDDRIDILMENTDFGVGGESE